MQEEASWCDFSVEQTRDLGDGAFNSSIGALTKLELLNFQAVLILATDFHIAACGRNQKIRTTDFTDFTDQRRLLFLFIIKPWLCYKYERNCRGDEWKSPGLNDLFYLAF